MTYLELVQRVGTQSGEYDVTVRRVLSAFVDVTRQAALARGETIHVPKLGVFYLRVGAPRRVRNVKDGELINLPESRALAFRAVKATKRKKR